MVESQDQTNLLVPLGDSMDLDVSISPTNPPSPEIKPNIPQSNDAQNPSFLHNSPSVVSDPECACLPQRVIVYTSPALSKGIGEQPSRARASRSDGTEH